MRRLLTLTLALASLLALPAFGALIAHTTRSGNGTTSAIDTTGATLLIVQWADASATRSTLPTDSKGNDWQCLAPVNTGGVAPISYTCYAYSKGGGALSVGSGHTFSYSEAFPFIMVSAWSGTPTGSTNPYDGAFNDNADTTSSATLTTGSITPSANGELVIGSFAVYVNAGTFSVNSGLAVLDQSPLVGGASYAGANAYLTQTTAAAINPTWTMDNGQGGVAYANIAAFKQSATSTFQVSSATVGSDGRTFTATMNGTYTSGTCAFSFSGGSASQFNAGAATVTPTGGSATITVVAAAPAYHGDTPVIALSTGGSCTGSTGAAASSTATATNGSDYYAAGDSHWSTLVTYQGSPSIGTDGNGYPNTPVWLSPNGSLDFALTSSAGTIAVWTQNGSQALTLLVDGAISSRVALASGSAYAETAFTGLDTGAHTFKARLSGTGAAWQAAVIEALRCPSCVFTTKPASLPLMGIMGASAADITGGGGATPNADRTDYGLMPVVTQGQSFSGQNMYLQIQGNCPTSMVPQGGASPAFAILTPDSNDVKNNVSLANETAAVSACVASIMGTASPPAKLFVRAPYIAPANDNAGSVCTGLTERQCFGAYAQAVQAGVVVAANANTTFVPTFTCTAPYASGCISSGAPDWMNIVASASATCAGDTLGEDLQSDAGHPCPATAVTQPGYGKLANREIPIQAGVTSGASFAASGPATGVQGSASGAFTATLGGTATTWLDPVTITSTNSGDTLCVGGTCGTGAVTSLASIGTHTFAFTVNAVSTGSRTISYGTLAAGWIAPSSNAYSASAATGLGSIVCLGACAIQHIP